MSTWDTFLTERDRAVFGQAGFGRRGGWGQRPVVLVIDVTLQFVGDRPEHIERSVERWNASCGEDAWRAVEHIAALLDTVRARGLPVIYTTGLPPRPDHLELGRWVDKVARWESDLEQARAANTIVEPIAPRPEDVVLEKGKPSAFFGTHLAALLVDLQADSLIVCGATTSGCVRATVVDGFSYNYRMAVVEECTFDRGQVSHAISLFDMHQKYADVVSAAEINSYLHSLPDGLFEARRPGLQAGGGQRRARSSDQPST